MTDFPRPRRLDARCRLTVPPDILHHLGAGAGSAMALVPLPSGEVRLMLVREVIEAPALLWVR